MGEFQSLGRVHGHQLHAVAAVARVGVCKQGHMGQIVLERAFLAARRLIFIDGLLQLGQIVQPL